MHALGVSPLVAGIAVAWTFAAAALVLLWLTLLRELPRRGALLGLAYAAFAPGYVYNFAVFPLSMFVTGCVAYLALLRARRWAGAGAAGFAAALVYPIGVIVLPVVGLVEAARATRRVVPAVLAAAPPAAAFLVVMLAQRVATGRWTAFFDVQAQYKHGLHEPFAVMWHYMSLVSFEWGAAPYWQTIVVTVAVVLSLAVAIRRRDWLLGVFTVACCVLPMTQANVSVWRSQTALLPIAALIGRLPRPVAAAITLAAIAVGIALARLYFVGGLV